MASLRLLGGQHRPWLTALGVLTLLLLLQVGWP